MTFVFSAIGFVQTSNAWIAPTGVLKAIGEFNKVDGFDIAVFAEIMDVTTIKHYKMINFDFKQKGVPNVTTALHNASKSGNFEVVNVLLDANADPNVCDSLGNSPLMKASKMGFVQIVRKLLQKDAELTSTRKIMEAGLHYLTLALKVTKMLLMSYLREMLILTFAIRLAKAL